MTTAWPAVRDKAADFGVTFQSWQDGAGRVILAKRDDGKYAAVVGGVVISIPRQVGKTFLIGAIVFALCLLHPNLTVIWTAHRVRTAEETFKSMQAFARRKKVRPHVAKVILGSGEEEVRFVNGSRILFGARGGPGGFGLGFSGVDMLVLDEAQRLRESTLEDIIPAMNQSKHPAGALVLMTGTPPRPTDEGEVFRRARTEVLSGDDDETAYIEFGADPGFVPTPLPGVFTEADWKQVAVANPSFPEFTPREAILRMRKRLGDDAMVREGFGRWDNDEASDVFGAGRWRRCTVGDGVELPDAPAAIGIAVSLDRTSASIASAALLEHDDGTEPDDEDDVPVFVAGVDQRPEVDWLIGEVKRIQDTHDCAVLADSKGPVADMREDFEDADVDVTWVSLEEYVAACSDLYDRVRKGPVRLLHPGSGDGEVSWLDAAVRGADWRSVGDGRRVWGRKKSASDVAMLEAATFAVRGAELSGVGIW